jgi:hypothetical protein
MAGNVALLCPQCGLIDQVRKVSAVVGAGTTANRGVGIGVAALDVNDAAAGVGVTAGTSRTTLSSLLSPPKEPTPPTNWTGCGLVVALGLGVVGLLFVTLALASSDDSAVSTVFIVFAAIFFAPAAMIIQAINRQKSAAEKTTLFKRAHEQWARAMERWKVLYYCARCDGVFIPGQNALVAAERMHSLLAEPETGSETR